MGAFDTIVYHELVARLPANAGGVAASSACTPGATSSTACCSRRSACSSRNGWLVLPLVVAGRDRITRSRPVEFHRRRRHAPSCVGRTLDARGHGITTGSSSRCSSRRAVLVQQPTAFASASYGWLSGRSRSSPSASLSSGVRDIVAAQDAAPGGALAYVSGAGGRADRGAAFLTVAAG